MLMYMLVVFHFNVLHILYKEVNISIYKRQEKTIMSQFSNECKQLLDSNELTAYRISKNSNLELTSLQRMLTGKRLPNLDFVKRFCETLRLPYLTEKHILELYFMEKLGAVAYENYTHFVSLISSLVFSDLENSISAESMQRRSAAQLSLSDFSIQTIPFEHQMQLVLQKAFENHSENAFIYSNIPADYMFFQRQILLLHSGNRKACPRIVHLLNLHMSATNACNNINALQEILPLAFSNNLDYDMFYYYSNLQPSDFAQMPFPYYIITGDSVLVISCDYQRYILHTDPTTIKAYQKEFIG